MVEAKCKAGETSEHNHRQINNDIFDIVLEVQAYYPQLRPAERRVADIAMENTGILADMTSAKLAVWANVSEPTVSRFCRAIGCDGLRDLKRKLAQMK